MAEQLQQGDAAGGGELGEVAIDRIVEVEQAAFGELQHRGGGEQLGAREQVIDGVGGGELTAAEVGEAERALPAQAGGVHQGDRAARDVGPGQGVLDGVGQGRGGGWHRLDS